MQINQAFLSLAIFSFISSAAPSYAQTYMPACECAINWTGLYIAGEVGMAANQQHTTFVNANYFNTIGPEVLGSNYEHRAQGVIAGGALGCNFQLRRLVIGLEGGAMATNLKKKRQSPFFPSTDTFTSHLEEIATGKLRLGYAYDTLLPYICGGWAGGREHVHLIDNSTNTAAHLKTWINGWTAGVGFDCKMVEWLSMGLEYDYTQLYYSNKETSCGRCGSGVGFGSPALKDSFHIQSLTMRLNYYFF